MNKENYLRQKGVNVDAGLNYTGDFETYDEIFNDFMLEFDNQINSLTSVKETGDMANYAIQVHALKGNLRCLGFDTYSSNPSFRYISLIPVTALAVNATIGGISKFFDNFFNICKTSIPSISGII